MVFKRKIPPQIRSRAYLLRKHSKKSFQEIGRICKISKSSARRCVLEPVTKQAKKSGKYKRAGRPNLLTSRDLRRLSRSIEILRKEDVNFTIKKLVSSSGLTYQQASYRTYVRAMNKMGYRYLQTRRKGLLSEQDKKQRMCFAKEKLSLLKKEPDFWTKKIAFYLDGVSFIYKRNPMAAALSPKARAWRLRSEGLKITSKGSKCLPGGKRLHLIVVVSYKSGVIFVEEYEKLNGIYFAGFVMRNFSTCFNRSIISPKQRRQFVMDNEPSQKSARAKKAIKKLKAQLIAIPPRSPDVNPIENVFHRVKKNLDMDAINNSIERESFNEFRVRVINTLYACDAKEIDKTIESLPKRLRDIVKLRGCRTKY